MTSETDLLTQLRSSRHSAFHGLTDALCEKAADEIERLRFALRVISALPLSEQDNMMAANMRRIAAEAISDGQ